MPPDLDSIAQRLQTHRPTSPCPTEHEAAVAVIFRPDLSLLFIRRAEQEGDPWSGHVAFPGGHMDPEDADLLAAVKREVTEEVGLDLDAYGRLLGRLPVQVTPPNTGRSIAVHPFVFVLHRTRPILPNGEVARFMWVPLDYLITGCGRSTMVWHLGNQPLNLPCVDVDGERLWGLTLRMVDDLIHLVR